MQNFMAQLRRPRRVQTTHAEVSLLSTAAPVAPQVNLKKEDATFNKAMERAEAATRSQPNQPAGAPAQPIVREEQKIGRNDPCHCGSGKKYKKCCGQYE